MQWLHEFWDPKYCKNKQFWSMTAIHKPFPFLDRPTIPNHAPWAICSKRCCITSSTIPFLSSDCRRWTASVTNGIDNIWIEQTLIMGSPIKQDSKRVLFFFLFYLGKKKRGGGPNEPVLKSSFSASSISFFCSSSISWNECLNIKYWKHDKQHII